MKKTKCIDEKKLSAYLDGELSKQERAAVEEYLGQCADCWLKAKNLAAVSEMLGLLPGIEPEPYFALRLRQRIAGEKSVSRVRWLRRILVPASASAAGVLALVLGMFLGKVLYHERIQSASESTSESAYILRVDTVKDFPEGSLGDVFGEIVEGGN